MNVTINTDASFCPHTNAAGFACWIVCDLGRIQYAAKLKIAESSMDAELKGIANALHLLKSSKFNNGKISYIYINCDCQAAFHVIGLRSTNSIGKNIAKKLKVIFKHNDKITTDKRYHLRYVKAHNGTPDKRSFVNDWCDKNAKTYMRQMRKDIRNGRE